MTPKETLGLRCILILPLTHWISNKVINSIIHSYCCCLPWDYVTRPFGILQRLMNSQRCGYHSDTAIVDTFSLRNVCCPILRLFWSNENEFIQQKNQTIPNKLFLRKKWGNVLTSQTVHGNFPIHCQMFLLTNINVLISKQKKTPKFDPKMLKQ